MRTTSANSAEEIRIGRKSSRQGAFRRPLRSISHSSDAPLLLKSQQMVSRHEQIGQRRHNEQAVAVFHHAAIVDLGKAKDALDDEKGVLHLGAHTRLPAVLLALTFSQPSIAKPLLIGEVTRLRCGPGDQRLLAGVGGVAIHPLLVAVQQLRERMFVVHVGRCRNNRMDQLGLTVHTDVRLHAEVPLVTLLRLVHLRVARLVLILGRGRGIDDGGIDDGAGRYLQSFGLQMPSNFLEQTFAQLMLFEQMAEFAYGGFIRCTFPTQIDTDELAHGQGVIESFFHRRIGKVEPVLEKVDTQHTLKTNRRASVSGLGVNRFDQGAQGRPRNYAFHLGQKRSATCRLAVPVKAARRKCRLFHRSIPFVKPSSLTA